jgi:PAS domain S-box/diguanylate cyclase (GGDEF) domain
MSRSSSSQPTRRLFVSLHWKGFFFLSVLLLTLSGFFAGLNYLYLKHQFARQRAVEVQLLEKKIKGLLAQSSERLQHLGAVLATVGGLDQALATGDSASLTQIITERYASVQYEMDIGRIELFTAAGEHFWSWELIPFRTLPAELMRQSMARVYERERPLTLLNCQPECALYAFVPILANGRNAGGIALAQSIAQIMIDFQQVTGADIGLMVPAFPSNGAHMPSWQMRFAVLTNAPMLRPLFEALSRQHTVDTLDRDAFYAWKGALYALHRIPLRQLTEAQDGAIVLISDVTEAINTIRAAVHDGLIMAGCALVIAELLLLLLVRVPIRRLQRFAATLPLLAGGAYAEARQRLARQGVPVRLTDEIDIVYETAMTLSHQLEERTAALSIKNQELAKERDFVQGLLDSAHVLILTQTREGEIRTVNQFAETLIGYSAQELCGRYFRELVEEPEVGDELESKLQALWAGEQRRLQHESELLCHDSSRRHVVWVHTRLRETDPESVAVLSVGLDVTDRVQAESRSIWLANHDPLTSLFNRHRFQEELERAFTRVARDGGHAALLFFDLDHFKDINDTSGHAAGDALLRLVANELRRRLRKGDIAGRLGGTSSRC